MQPADAYVVDASVAVKWHLPDEDHLEEARFLLRRFIVGQCFLFAPDHIRYEVPNVIAMATQGRGARLTVDQGREATDEFLALGIQTVGDDALVRTAYSLVHQYGCALYDALYLALAQRFRLPLVTADARLFRRVGSSSGAVWIGALS